MFGRKEGGAELNITIVGRANLNRAMHGDVVAVQLLPEIQWKAAATELVVDEGMPKRVIGLTNVLFPFTKPSI